MRNLFYCVVVLVMVLAIASCQENKEANIVFERVEGMMDDYPDSALAILDSMRTESEGYPRSQRMRYELLHAKAQNKAYVDFTTDSVMKEVVEYYDDHGTPNEQMEAHYLLGCVYRDLKESPMALSCYLDATEKADTLSEDCDYDALMRVWGQIADEYDRQCMPLKELEALNQYGRCSIKCDNYYSYITSKLLKRRAYFMLGDTINAINITKEAFKMSMRKGLVEDAARSLFPIIPIYIDKNDMEMVDSLVGIVDSKSGIIDKNGSVIKGYEHYYRIKALYYDHKNNLEMSEKYYRKLLANGFEYDAYKGLLKIYHKQCISDSIYKYSLLKEEAFIQTFSDFHTQSMFNAEGMFNYSRNQCMAAEKTLAAERNRINAIIIGVLLVFIILLFVGFVIKKRREVQNLENVCRAMKEDYLKSLQDYNLMESDFEAYKAMKSAEMQELEEKWEMASAKQCSADRTKAVSVGRKNVAIENILKKEKYSFGYVPEITEAEWNDAYNAIKGDFPRFYTAIITNPDISDQERKVALLSLLGLATKSIAYLMNTTPSNVSNVKTRTNNKLFGDNCARTFAVNIETL